VSSVAVWLDVEVVPPGVDALIWSATAVKLGKQPLKPMRMLVKNRDRTFQRCHVVVKLKSRSFLSGLNTFFGIQVTFEVSVQAA
jgi:hypothetical protein